MKGAAASKAIAIEGSANVIATRDPRTKARVERAIRDQVGSARCARRNEFDIIEQALAFTHKITFEGKGSLGAIVELAGRLNRCPRRLRAFIAVRPTERQSMIAARID